jgi:hypothetical protein
MKSYYYINLIFIFAVNVFFFYFGNMFIKFLRHTQFLEVYTASKEIMLFHDNGFVLLRFAYSFIN